MKYNRELYAANILEVSSFGWREKMAVLVSSAEEGAKWARSPTYVVEVLHNS